SENFEKVTRLAEAGDTASQARLGTMLFQAGRIEEAVPWLEQASAGDQSSALNLLGVMHVNGLAVPLDFARAISLLSRAAHRGLKEASYTLAGLYANGFGVTADQESAWHYLMQACQGGHMPALRVAGLLYALDESDSTTGSILLRLAAGGGDGLAQSALVSLLLLSGNPEDVAEAGYWASQAAAHGVYSVMHFIPSLTSSGMQPPMPAEPQWASLSRAVSKVLVTENCRPVVSDIIYEIDEVLPPFICEYLINLSAPRLRPSLVMDPKTGQQMQNPVRTSHSMYFPPSMYDCAVGVVRSRMATLAGLPVEHAEPLAVLRYAPGQEYKPHQDYFVGTTATDSHTNIQGGQRAVTVFAYLNDVESGGETEFPELGVRIRAVRGRAVKFLNLNNDGHPNPKTLHAGCPVNRGEKWLATFWFRQRPFSWSS
ncbi:MAG: 2OG-Fe(II) oxygenase, partial [Ktedonobacteraceae bacterium]